MALSSLALAVAVSLGVVYVVLGVVAFNHVITEKTTSLVPRAASLTFWWPFYDIYDEQGRKLSVYGKIVFVLTIAAYVLWFSQRA